MSYEPSVHREFDDVGYIVEGSTDATFGQTPTTPTYLDIGIPIDLTIDHQISKEDILSLGNYDIVNAVKTGEICAFTTKSNIISSTLAKFGVNAPGGGAGTVDESLSFIYSRVIDGTTNYQEMLGARPVSTKLKVDRGLWEQEIQWVCQDITDYSTSAPSGATLATIPASSPWSHVDSAADPFTWNAVTYDTNSFESTTTFELSLLDVNGQLLIQNSRAANRRTLFTAEIFQKNTSLQSDHSAFTKRAASMVINSGTSTLSFTDARITKYDSNPSAASTNIVMESIIAEVENVSLT